MNMFKNFLEWFLKPNDVMDYGTGALLNPEDPRDVRTSAFQPENSLPEKYITDISMLPRYDQKQNGSCVGHAITLALAYYEFKENGSKASLSPRFIYGMAKKIDGLLSQGTYPRCGGLVAKDYGCPLESLLYNDSYLPHEKYISFELNDAMKKDASYRRIKGFAFADESEYDLKNAIMNNGVVCISLKVGKWSKLPVKSGDNGRHYVLAYGWNKDKIYFANSWGKNWGDKNLGDGYFLFSDFKDAIRDIMVITDIPNQVLEDAKKNWPYKFFKPSEFKHLDKIKPATLDLIEKIRGKYGKPMVPASDWRVDPSHSSGCEIDFKATGARFYDWIFANYAVGRGREMWDKLHTLDQFKDDDQYKLALVAVNCGATRIGIYDRHVHIGFDPSSPQKVMWAGKSE